MEEPHAITDNRRGLGGLWNVSVKHARLSFACTADVFLDIGKEETWR